MIKSKKLPKRLKRTPIKRKSHPNRKLETESDSDEPKVQKYTLPNKKYTLPNKDVEKVQKYVRPVKEPKLKKKPKPMNRRGKKTTEWEIARAELKLEFENSGITSCQLRWQGCWINNALSFAHRLKRRFIKDKKELKVVGLICVPCHNRVEYMSKEKMYEIVTELHEQFLNKLNGKK